MSATRDKSQNFTFVYSNLYQLYKKGHEAAKAADLSHLDSQESKPSPESKISSPVTEAPSHVAITKAGLVTAKIIKAADLNQGGLSTIRISKPLTPSLLGKRIEVRSEPVAVSRVPVVKTALRTLVQKPDASKTQALDSLKQNLKSLNDLHARLRFMLKELEELVKE